MKKHFAVLFAALAVALAPTATFAQGFIVVPETHAIERPEIHPPRPPWSRPPFPRPHPIYAPLEVHSHDARVKIEDQVAKTEIEQEFYNPTRARLEGFYMFPLPKGAQIEKFSMWIDGKETHAELLSADKARRIYEDIVRSQRDPALLEYVGRDLLKARIFPIEPNSRTRVKISYVQLLKAERNTVEYTYPLNTEKFSAKPLRNVSIKIDIASKDPLLAIYSPTHTVDIRRRDDNRAVVGFEARNTKPDMDFQLFFSRQKRDIGVSLLTYRPNNNEDGYFLMLATPSFRFGQNQVAAKDVVFVADTSGSMAGGKMDQLKRALQYCIANLGEDDRFEIVRFSTEADSLFSELRDADKGAVREARKFIEDFRAAGGTAIDEALQKALKLRPTGKRPFIVVFLTDGRPTIGETNEDKIAARLRDADSTTRIFTFGIGTDLNTRLLDLITDTTKAASQYVLPEEDIEVKVSSFFDKIRDPVLTDVELRVEGGVRLNQLYPKALPDIFSGEQLVVFGRYSGSGDAAVRVSGYVNGKKTEYVFEERFTRRDDEHPFIARLWATRRVGYLLDEIRLRGETSELRDEVIRLAREHGIVTPYTSYLIVEDERRRLAANPHDQPQPAAPAFQRAMSEPKAAEEAAKQWLSIARREQLGAEGWRANFASDAVNQLKYSANLQQQQQQQAQQQQQQSQDPQQQQPQALERYFSKLGNADAKRDAPVAIDLSQQVRQIGARTFYNDGKNWVDGDIQKKQANVKRVQIKFGSREYFDLLAKIPEAAAWFALGNNVHFTHGDTVYEIVEAETPR